MIASQGRVARQDCELRLRVKIAGYDDVTLTQRLGWARGFD